MPDAPLPKPPEDRTPPSVTGETADYQGTYEIPADLKAELYAPGEPGPGRDFDSPGDRTEMEKLDSRVSGSRGRSGPPIAANHKLIQNIGQGTFGTVWKAVNVITDEPVAIKFFLRGGVLESVIDETRMLGKLAGCTGIMGYKEVSFDSADPYFVMPLAVGGSLADRIRRGRLDVATAVMLFEQVVDAMAFVHSKGVIHCDLKPANVLLSEDGKPLIADFGQSHLTTNNSLALGTFFYMAPEQATLRESLPDTRWDVYALGAILHELLTGEPPRASKEFRDGLANLKTNDVRERLRFYRNEVGRHPLGNLRQVNRKIDAPLARLVERCLDINPANRPQDAGDVRALLARRRRDLKNAPIIHLALKGTLLGFLGIFALSFFAASSIINDSETQLRREMHRSLRNSARLGGQLLEEKLRDRMQFLIQSTRRMEERPEMLERLRRARGKYREAIQSGAGARDFLALVPRTERQQTGEWLRNLDTEFRRGNLLMDDPAVAKEEEGAAEISSYSLVVRVDRGAFVIARCEDDGRVTVDAPDFANNRAWREYFNGVRDEQGREKEAFDAKPAPHFTRMCLCDRLSDWVIDLSAPVYDPALPEGHPDRLLGKIVTSVKRDKELARWFREGARGEETMEFVVAIRARDGMQWNIFGGDSLELDESRPEGLLPRSLGDPSAESDDYFPEPDVHARHRGRRGSESIAAWREFRPDGALASGRPWYFVAKLSREQATISHDKLRRQIRALGFTLFLIILAAALLAWYWLLRLLRSGDTMIPESGPSPGLHPVPDSTAPTTDTKHHG